MHGKPVASDPAQQDVSPADIAGIEQHSTPRYDNRNRGRGAENGANEAGKDAVEPVAAAQRQRMLGRRGVPSQVLA